MYVHTYQLWLNKSRFCLHCTHAACWFGQSSAQCACNDTGCVNTAIQNNPNAQSVCCNWVAQPIDTNPQSLNDADGTPLGFSLLEYRGTDSNLPNLCVRVSFPTPLRNIRYVVAAVSLTHVDLRVAKC